jgi:DNA-binding NarL/FixJ family response regulator
VNPTRLVLVDDDQALVGELAALLTDVGYDVVGVAGDGVSGIDLVARTEPDAVVMDVRMPGMSGTEAADILRVRHPDLPVIVMSAYDDEGIVAAADAAQVAAYLVKGCSAEELCSTLDTVVAHRRGLEES